MFDREQVERAVALNERGRAFMTWVAECDRDLLRFEHVHRAISVPDAMRDWVERNDHALPMRCRPAPEDRASFANLVGTYLETSFDLVHVRRDSHGACNCDACIVLRSMSSLKTKQLTRHDKDDA